MSIDKLIILDCFFAGPGGLAKAWLTWRLRQKRTGSNEVLSSALDLHIQKIPVATDCKPVVNHLKEAYKGPSAMTISHIKNLFQAATVIFEPRESNREAHTLARAYLSLAAGRHLWLLQLPDFACIPTYVWL